MRNTRAAVVLAAATASFLPFALTAYSGGPPVRRTGAPGDRTCLDANCHVGTRLENSGALELDAAPTFVPGSGARRWNIRITDNAARAYGLQVTTRAARDLIRSPGGSLATLEPLTSVICGNEVFKGAAGCAASDPVEFFHHTEPRARNSFALAWTPPAEPTDVAVYLIANASVAGQRNSRIHSRAWILRPAGGGGVVNAASLQDGITSGSWFSIFDTALPEDAEVLVDGRRARVSYASETQINARAPEITAPPGPIVVEIRRHGVLIMSRLAMHRLAAPGMFDRGVIPARPGEVVRLYATGLASTASVKIGQREAPAAVTPSETEGVQLVDFTVPELTAGEYLVSIVSGGENSNTATLRVGPL